MQGPGGRRSIPVTDFFQGYFETALEPDEIVVELGRPDRLGRLGLREVHPAGQRLGDRRRRGRCGRVALANMAGTVVRADRRPSRRWPGRVGRGRGRAGRPGT